MQAPGVEPTATSDGVNQPPTVRALRIDPDEPAMGGRVRAVASGSDPDGDPVHIRYRWQIDGRPVPGEEREIETPAALLIRPQQRTVGVVDITVAIGPEERHVAGGCDQLRLQPPAGGIGFAPAGGETDRAAAVARAKCAHDIDGQLSIDADEGRVGAARKFFD